MYSQIETYLELRIAELAALTSTDLRKVDIDLDRDLLSENQKEYSYMLKIDNYEEDESEAPVYNVESVVELTFILPNSNTVKYQPVIDDYVHKLVRLIQLTRKYEYSSNWGMEVKKVSARKLNDFTENELKAEIVMQVMVLDNIDPEVPVPDAPTLTSPSDGSTTGTTDQAFQWSNVSGANSYEIEISQAGTVVISQTDLAVSSYTVPLDSALTDATVYTWRVRAIGDAGAGAWSSIRTLTIDDVATPAVPSLVSPLASTETSNTVDFVWDVSLRSTSYDFQLATDSGFTSLLVDTNLAHTTYEYTFSSNATYYWRVRGSNVLGDSAWASSSVILNATYPVADYRTGLIHEWIADSGLTSNASGISAWDDLVGSLDMAQSVDANKPVLVTNFINGRNALYFNNNAHYLTFTETAFSTYTIIVVYKATSITPGQGNDLIASNAGGDVMASLGAVNLGWGVLLYPATRNAAYNVADTNWNVRSFQALKLYSNGVEVSPYAGTGNPLTVSLAAIGRRPNSNYPFKGYIAAIRIYDSVLSTTDRAIAENYLNSLYDIY